MIPLHIDRHVLDLIRELEKRIQELEKITNHLKPQ